MTSKQGRRFRRPQFSTVLALVALFAALGGAAYAGSKINGKDIKKNTVTSKAIKNETLKTKDLNPKTVNALKGQQGPQGPKGNPGTPGADGVVDPLSGTGGSVNLPDGADLGVATLNVPAGEYIFQAKTNLFGGAGVTRIDCSLTRNGTLDAVQWNPPGANTRVPVSFLAVETVQAGAVTVGCMSNGGTGSASNTRIVAIPVG